MVTPYGFNEASHLPPPFNHFVVAMKKLGATTVQLSESVNSMAKLMGVMGSTSYEVRFNLPMQNPELGKLMEFCQAKKEVTLLDGTKMLITGYQKEMGSGDVEFDASILEWGPEIPETWHPEDFDIFVDGKVLPQKTIEIPVLTKDFEIPWKDVAWDAKKHPDAIWQQFDPAAMQMGYPFTAWLVLRGHEHAMGQRVERMHLSEKEGFGYLAVFKFDWDADMTRIELYDKPNGKLVYDTVLATTLALDKDDKFQVSISETLVSEWKYK